MFIYHHLSERYISIFPTKQMIRLQTVSKNPQIFQTAVLLYSALHAEHTPPPTPTSPTLPDPLNFSTFVLKPRIEMDLIGIICQSVGLLIKNYIISTFCEVSWVYSPEFTALFCPQVEKETRSIPPPDSSPRDHSSGRLD